MKHYIGTKHVMARPMTKWEAQQENLLQTGKVCTSQDDKCTPGYEVIYEGGYRSWSPKDVFEQSYQVSETFLDSMHIEYTELNDRTQKLEAFVKTDKFYHLGAIQQGRLMRQLSAMQQYREWLRLRIEDSEQHQ